MLFVQIKGFWLNLHKKCFSAGDAKKSGAGNRIIADLYSIFPHKKTIFHSISWFGSMTLGGGGGGHSNYFFDGGVPHETPEMGVLKVLGKSVGGYNAKVLSYELKW